MAANDAATVTIDTNEWVYPDRDGIETHTVTNAQTFGFTLTAGGVVSIYTGTPGATSLNCDDGTKLVISNDPQFTRIDPVADTNSGYRRGAMRVREGSGFETDWDISEITIDNIDQPTEITSATFTAKDNPMRTFTWTTVTVAQ